MNPDSILWPLLAIPVLFLVVFLALDWLDKKLPHG